MICTVVNTKKIVVVEFLKFQRSNVSDIRDSIQRMYGNGYWNVFKYNQTLVDFLDKNEILYSISE